MVELILGTVQLGLDYGINNRYGKPDIEKSFEMLDYAFNNGIKILDTANAYGDSESVIGQYISNTGNEFKIATKLSSFDNSMDIQDFFNNQLLSSLELLSKDKIDYYLIHNFNDLFENHDLLNLLKNNDKILNIGVSLYEPSELEFILQNFSKDIDFVQIPFNILDSRWINDDLLSRTKEENIKIFVRSIFVQGLIFMDDEHEMNKIHPVLKEYIDFIRKLSFEKNVPINRLAMDYVKSYSEIDGILIGCDTIGQLKENIYQFNSDIIFNKEDINNIINLTKNIPNKIIDPRRW